MKPKAVATAKTSPRRVMRKPEVRARTGLSLPTIDRLEKLGQFPRRLQLSVASVGWYEDEIDQWLDTRPRVAVAAA